MRAGRREALSFFIYDTGATLTMPEVAPGLFAVGGVCSGSSIVLALPLGRPLLCGLWASATRGGTSAKLPAPELIELRCGGDATLSTRSVNLCSFFSI
jgi:hypothetical protein